MNCTECNGRKSCARCQETRHSYCAQRQDIGRSEIHTGDRPCPLSACDSMAIAGKSYKRLGMARSHEDRTYKSQHAEEATSYGPQGCQTGTVRSVQPSTYFPHPARRERLRRLDANADSRTLINRYL